MLSKSLFFFFSKLFTLQTSVRQKEKLTVMLAHSLQMVHVNHSPEVESSVKQTQAIISKWLIHIFMLVLHNSNPAASTVPLLSATNARSFKSQGRNAEAAIVVVNSSEDSCCSFLFLLYFLCL